MDGERSTALSNPSLTATEPRRTLRAASSEPRRRAILVVHRGSEVELVELEPGSTTIIGRTLPANVVVSDSGVSRQHASLRWADDGLWIEDLGSRNGTWLGGRSVNRARVRSGEDIELGAARLSVYLPSEGAPSTPSSRQAPGSVIPLPSAGMRRVYDLVARVAGAPLPVLVLGETGTGKEGVARAIHERSDRRGQQLTVVNCAAIPGTLTESVLFGHEKGAFTGAQKRAAGVFEKAHRSTVFLDEIGELSPAAQAALLRVLETGVFCRVGSNAEIHVDVRVVTATHRNLASMVEEGTFRADLFHRLNTVTIPVPPLRARPDDVGPLFDHFLRDTCALAGRTVGVQAGLKDKLAQHGWPGNVRELRNAVQRAVVLCDTEVGIEHFEFAKSASSFPVEETDPAIASLGDESMDFKDRVQAFETRLIRDALVRAEGNRTAAARLLRIPLRTLAYKLRAYDIPKDLGKRSAD